MPATPGKTVALDPELVARLAAAAAEAVDGFCVDESAGQRYGWTPEPAAEPENLCEVEMPPIADDAPPCVPRLI